MKISEKNFEAAIEEALVEGGYRQRPSGDYDKARCLIPDDVFDFIFASQPETWADYADQVGDRARGEFLRRLQRQVERKGTVEVLRRGIRDRGCRFEMAYFVPATGLNPDYQRLYEANRFTVVRQLRYSAQNENSLDLAIFLNGLPIFTAELKESLKNQTVEDAKRQYRYDRDPRGEPLFDFGRVLAHFAVDPDLVYYTTRLQGADTRFLPFNRGAGTGAGNPPASTGSPPATCGRRSGRPTACSTWSTTSSTPSRRRTSRAAGSASSSSPATTRSTPCGGSLTTPGSPAPASAT